LRRLAVVDALVARLQKRAEKAEEELAALRESWAKAWNEPAGQQITRLSNELAKAEVERDGLRGRVAVVWDALEESSRDCPRICEECGERSDCLTPGALESNAGEKEAAVIKAAPGGLEEATYIIQRLYTGVFGHVVNDWGTYAPKLTAAMKAVDHMEKA